MAIIKCESIIPQNADINMDKYTVDLLEMQETMCNLMTDMQRMVNMMNEYKKGNATTGQLLDALRDLTSTWNNWHEKSSKFDSHARNIMNTPYMFPGMLPPNWYNTKFNDFQIPTLNSYVNPSMPIV